MLTGLLPIGSVVSLRDVDAKVMVVGYLPKDPDHPETEHEYSGMFYPLGYRSADQILQFDMDAVTGIQFVGYQDREQMEFEEYILGLGEEDDDGEGIDTDQPEEEK